jgi:hypothetical protein
MESLLKCLCQNLTLEKASFLVFKYSQKCTFLDIFSYLCYFIRLSNGQVDEPHLRFQASVTWLDVGGSPTTPSDFTVGHRARSNRLFHLAPGGHHAGTFEPEPQIVFPRLHRGPRPVEPVQRRRCRRPSGDKIVVRQHR